MTIWQLKEGILSLKVTDVLQPNYVENGIPCHNRATANFYKNNPTK